MERQQLLCPLRLDFNLAKKVVAGKADPVCAKRFVPRFESFVDDQQKIQSE